MLRQFVVTNINLVSIIVFLLLFAIIMVTKPNVIFDKNGKPREFGIGYKKKNNITFMVNSNYFSNNFIFIYFMLYKFQKICILKKNYTALACPVPACAAPDCAAPACAVFSLLVSKSF